MEIKGPMEGKAILKRIKLEDSYFPISKLTTIVQYPRLGHTKIKIDIQINRIEFRVQK
jgi:hypothetical protein